MSVKWGKQQYYELDYGVIYSQKIDGEMKLTFSRNDLCNITQLVRGGLDSKLDHECVMLHVLDWIVPSHPPLSLYITTLAPTGTVFRDRDFKEIVKVTWGHEGGP